jgi:SAM-dependent methyltransferase
MLLALVALGGCHEAQQSSAPADAQSVPDASTANLDEAALKVMSRGLLDAFDRDDDEALSKSLSASFVFFANQQAHHREVLSWAKERRAHHALPRTRTHGEEHVTFDGATAVFIGESVVHAPADDGRPAVELDGWNTLVWTRGADGWKATMWQMAKAGLDADRERWNGIYRGGAFKKAPSTFLAEVVKERKPGVALDVDMGQGRNAVFLASQGWRVTGIDISDEGLRIARHAAEERHLAIDAIEADDHTWNYGTGRWDLVALIYAGCDAALVAKLRTAVKPGGLVVVEGFHKDAAPVIGFGNGELAALFASDFTVLRDDVVSEESGWGIGNGTREKVVHFLAQRR